MDDETAHDAGADDDTDGVLAAVGPRLRRIRKEREVTLAALSEATGISVSTLSRLESGLRKPSLELLLPIARAHQVPLDELVGAPPVGDPRVRARPIVRHGRTYLPLTRQPGGLQAFKIIEPRRTGHPDPRTHEGYEWVYVLSGKLRLVLGEHDVVLAPGEAAEFDTRVPHWFGSTGEGPVEFLSLFGPQGERMHVRARPRQEGGGGGAGEE
ncbi:helix-turn-helix domain-containing protein [Streptomyces mangrovisoli]|uniref:XRE family transcriptional regulator n=1 Tax=Streptomyces mangrovisoli TaxID=1428628 RepID=A0A1J4NX18_9ACTN|nr:XRE family transcriptional regulator [Streptomyces mangrovisoli]OIJ66856.1 XRE family transcriptional regulator [Streptomyces mangrovisoli]